ncbi:MAG: NAD-dependent epimerase/dehydratase family protein [Sulfuriferula sp.]
MKKRVLITGSNGFTGHYMAAEMHDAGYEVFGLTHRAPAKPSPYITATLVCNLSDQTGLTRIVEESQANYVIHLAGIAFVAHGDVDTIYRTNLVGTRNLLEALSKSTHKPSSILLASSANIYGNATVEPITEDTPAAPANDYAVSKLAMEYMARLWLDRLPITLTRPFNYTGAGQSLDFLLPKIVDHFNRRLPVLELGNLNVVRDFSDVRSVARSYRLLLEATPSGEAYNVCSGHGYSLLEVLAIMRELTNHDPEIRVNPAFVRSNEVHRLIGSRGKLDGAIGNVPNIPLRDTLQWMLESTT